MEMLSAKQKHFAANASGRKYTPGRRLSQGIECTWRHKPRHHDTRCGIKHSHGAGFRATRGNTIGPAGKKHARINPAWVVNFGQCRHELARLDVERLDRAVMRR